MAFDSDAFCKAAESIVADYEPVAAAYLFGSCVRGEERPDSDVDVALLLANRDDSAADHYRMLGDIAGRLEQLVSPRLVDLVVLNEHDPLFCHAVLLEGQRFIERDRMRRIDFESTVVVRAMDFRPTYEIAVSGRIAGLRRWLASTQL